MAKKVSNKKPMYGNNRPFSLKTSLKIQKPNMQKVTIDSELPVICEEMTVEEAKKQGAIGVFDEKYGDKVKVYSIGDFSKEICGGPHVSNTSELGRFRILKEQSSSAGVRRIKAKLEERVIEDKETETTSHGNNTQSHDDEER